MQTRARIMRRNAERVRQGALKYTPWTRLHLRAPAPPAPGKTTQVSADGADEANIAGLCACAVASLRLHVLMDLTDVFIQSDLHFVIYQ